MKLSMGWPTSARISTQFWSLPHATSIFFSRMVSMLEAVLYNRGKFTWINLKTASSTIVAGKADCASFTGAEICCINYLSVTQRGKKNWIVSKNCPYFFSPVLTVIEGSKLTVIEDFRDQFSNYVSLSFECFFRSVTSMPKGKNRSKPLWTRAAGCPCVHSKYLLSFKDNSSMHWRVTEVKG